jgi:hypothetical protein
VSRISRAWSSIVLVLAVSGALWWGMSGDAPPEDARSNHATDAAPRMEPRRRLEPRPMDAAKQVERDAFEIQIVDAEGMPRPGAPWWIVASAASSTTSVVERFVCANRVLAHGVSDARGFALAAIELPADGVRVVSHDKNGSLAVSAVAGVEAPASALIVRLPPLFAGAPSGIVETEGHEPLGGVTAALKLRLAIDPASAWPLRLEARSDPAGELALPMRASAPAVLTGTIELEKTGYVALGGRTLGAARPVDSLGRPVFSMRAAGELVIRFSSVTSEEALPIFEGMLVFDGAAAPVRFRADESGEARVLAPDLPEAHVWILTEGWHVARLRGAEPAKGHLGRCSILGGQPRRMEVLVAPDRALRGRLEMAYDGSPAAGVDVVAHGVEAPDSVEGNQVFAARARRAVTDAAGAFAIDRVAAGYWRLEIESSKVFVDERANRSRWPAANPFRERFERGAAPTVVLNAESRQLEIQVFDDVETPELVVVVSAAGGIAGRLRDPAARGVAGAEIIAELAGWSRRDGRSIDYAQRLTATSDAQGDFAFHDVAPGTWSLRAEKAGYPDAVRGPLTVEGGRTTTAELALEAGVFATVRVKSVDPSLVYGIDVVAMEYPTPIVWPLRHVAARARTDGKGEARVGPLRAGRYEVALQDLRTLGLSPIGPSSQSIAVATAAPPPVELEVALAMKMTGQVIDVYERAVWKAQLMVKPDGAGDERAIEVRADENGAFELWVPERLPYRIMWINVPSQPGSTGKLGANALVVSGDLLMPGDARHTIICRY